MLTIKWTSKCECYKSLWPPQIKKPHECRYVWVCPPKVYPTFLYPILGNIWLNMIKYERKSPTIKWGFYREVSGIYSRVGVERFELPISCSQSRLKILYKSNFTSVSVVEVEPIITLQIESCGGYSQEMVLVLGQNLPIVQSYISSASNATRN